MLLNEAPIYSHFPREKESLLHCKNTITSLREDEGQEGKETTSGIWGDENKDSEVFSWYKIQAQGQNQKPEDNDAQRWEISPWYFCFLKISQKLHAYALKNKL